VPPKVGKFDPNHRTPEEIKLAKKREAKIAKTARTRQFKWV